MAKFEKGDRFIPRKPKENNSNLEWVSNMDKYDGKELVVEYIYQIGELQCPVVDGWVFHPDWCEKVEAVEPMKAGIFDEHIRGELDLLENKNFMTGYPLSPQPQTLSTEIDWEQRKWEASVAALSCVPARYKDHEGIWRCRDSSDIALEAIRIADEMIKQLKGDE